jgi:hypothetical protein
LSFKQPEVAILDQLIEMLPVAKLAVHLSILRLWEVTLASDVKSLK